MPQARGRIVNDVVDRLPCAASAGGGEDGSLDRSRMGGGSEMEHSVDSDARRRLWQSLRLAEKCRAGLGRRIRRISTKLRSRQAVDVIPCASAQDVGFLYGVGPLGTRAQRQSAYDDPQTSTAAREVFEHRNDLNQDACVESSPTRSASCLRGTLPRSRAILVSCRAKSRPLVATRTF